jgi:hypothetical protein
LTTSLKLFIAGAPRTGTSILLFALKDVFELPGYGESHVIPAFNEMIHRGYEYLQPFRSTDSAITREMMVGALQLPDIRAHLSQFIREFYQVHFPGGSWVDKTPSSPGVFALVLAEQVFPDARLIVTYRNGIEVVASHVKKFNASFEEACDIWKSAMEGLGAIRPLCKNLLVVDQFDFSNATDDVASKIARHLFRADRAADLALYLRNQRVESSSTHDWGGRLRLANMSWSEADKELFRRKCGETMREYGYEI